MEIEDYRAEINAVDDELRALFLRRMEAARQIGLYKKTHGLPVLDSSREETILSRVSEGLESPLDELTRELYRTLFSLSRKYQTLLQQTGMRYGLLGKSLSHSFSPELHRALWGAEYGLFSMEEPEARHFLQGNDFDGLNVTIPYKKLAFSMCDETDEISRRIGAVNTVLRRNGKLYGWNTDYFGMQAALENAGICLQNKKVLIFGSGGTSHTAQVLAEDLGAGSITVISRSGEENYENLYARHADAEILINTTPVGMYPDCGASIVELRRFPKCCGVMDVVYNPLKTRLIQQAEALHIPAASGLLMLVEQARRSAELFSGSAVDVTRTAECYQRLLHKNRNLVLVGMPGSGKTTLGRFLSEKLFMPFADSDEELLRITGRSAKDWIEQAGESAFREKEAEVIRGLCSRHGLVISTGGGTVLREDNRQALRQNGWICHVRRPLEALACSGRPLSENKAALKQLFRERDPIYTEISDYACDNVSSPEEAVSQIAEAWLK